VADAVSGIDLNATLPATVRLGGVFSVSPSGSSLPTGVTLSPSGLLTASASAVLTTITGVVFSYVEP